jgi:hypothetical protein
MRHELDVPFGGTGNLSQFAEIGQSKNRVDARRKIAPPGPPFSVNLDRDVVLRQGSVRKINFVVEAVFAGKTGLGTIDDALAWNTPIITF